MKKGEKAGIVCCSNPLTPESKKELEELAAALREAGLVPVFGRLFSADDGDGSWRAADRAAALMEFYRDGEIQVIFDISGGDMANEILPYLDYETILRSGKQFWGYSDLTTVLNALCTKWESGRRALSRPDGQKRGRTDVPAVLYQVRNLTGRDACAQRERFCKSVFDGKDDLFSFEYEFIQGEKLEGILAGGNIRCLLKLAGTEYWPDLRGRILLLEARGGGEPQMRTYLAQLAQLGVFEQVSGILLGTFTKMEEQGEKEKIKKLVCSYAKSELPVVKTGQIGHGADSRAAAIGSYLSICKEKILDSQKLFV